MHSLIYSFISFLILLFRKYFWNIDTCSTVRNSRNITASQRKMLSAWKYILKERCDDEQGNEHLQVIPEPKLLSLSAPWSPFCKTGTEVLFAATRTRCSHHSSWQRGATQACRIPPLSKKGPLTSVRPLDLHSMQWKTICVIKVSTF